MTVDSRYAIAQYDEDGEVTYRFFTESIGDEAMQVWKVSATGARTQLASNEYSIAYDLSQAPTFIGGTITLVTPLADGEKLSVERKTPIVNDLTLESLTPFPSERFEYMMDKICFIQQEIEGSYCDCRDSGGDIPVPPNVCKVYDCDAIQIVVDKYGADYWPLLEKNYKSGPYFGNTLVPSSVWPNPNEPGLSRDHYEWDGTPGLGNLDLGWTDTTTWASASLGISGDLETTVLAASDFNPCIDPITPEGMWGDDGDSRVFPFWHYKRSSEDFDFDTADAGRRYGRMSHNFSGIFYRFNQNSSVIALSACTSSIVTSLGNRDSGTFDVLITRYNGSVGGYTAGDLVVSYSGGTGNEIAIVPNTPGGFNNTPVYIGLILTWDYDNREHRRVPFPDNGRASFDCYIQYTGRLIVRNSDSSFDVDLPLSGERTFGRTFGEIASESDPDYVLPVSNYNNIEERQYFFAYAMQLGFHSLVGWQQLTPVDALQEYFDAWKQAADDYVDPDPQCIPRCKVYSCSAYERGVAVIPNIQYWSMNDQATNRLSPDVGGWAPYWSDWFGDPAPTPDQPAIYSTCEDGGGMLFDPARSFRLNWDSGFSDSTGTSQTYMTSNQSVWSAVIQPITQGDNNVRLFYTNWATIDQCAMWVHIENNTDIKVRIQRTGGPNPNQTQTISGVLTADQTANIMVTVDWSTNSPVVSVYKNFVLVEALTFTDSGSWFTNTARRWVVAYQQNTGEGGTGAVSVQSMWWLDRALTAQELTDIKSAWDQNQVGYVDPDPTCFPNNVL